MYKLIDILDTLGKDPDCYAVVFTTNSPHFCQGIDYTDIAEGSLEKRKHSSLHMAGAIK